MDKHINILKKLLKGYWNRRLLLNWGPLPSDEKQQLIKVYIYNYLIENEQTYKYTNSIIN